MRRTDVYIREDQHADLKELADKETTTISLLIRRAVDTFLMSLEITKPRTKVEYITERPIPPNRERLEKIISNPLIAKAVELKKEKGGNFTPVPKPTKK